MKRRRKRLLKTILVGLGIGVPLPILARAVFKTGKGARTWMKLRKYEEPLSKARELISKAESLEKMTIEGKPVFTPESVELRMRANKILKSLPPEARNTSLLSTLREARALALIGGASLVGAGIPVSLALRSLIKKYKKRSR